MVQKLYFLIEFGFLFSSIVHREIGQTPQLWTSGDLLRVFLLPSKGIEIVGEQELLIESANKT